MEYNSGKFTCPKCDAKMMSIYTDWMNRKINVNNIIETQWVFIKKTITNEKNLSVLILRKKF